MRHAALVLVLGLVGGCGIDDHLVQCANNLVCPADTQCDDVHGSCATPAQLAACAGLAPGADCDADGFSGGCFDGVCIVRGCGNRIVEAGEQCDDGNERSRDGCSGDCRSTETCGNGVVDPTEQCDDGNFISRDGCDSTCVPETPTWTQDAMYPERGAGAFDDARHRFVVAGSAYTFEWDGTSWSGTRANLDLAQDMNVFWDSDRSRVVAIISHPSLPTELREWDGSSWTLRATTGAPTDLAWPLATYDRANHRLVVLAIVGITTAAWTVNSAGVWSQLAVPSIDLTAELGPGHSLAFDSESNTVVLLAGTTEWVLDGSSWSSSQPSGLPAFGGSLVFHAGRGHLWLIGGYGSDQVLERSGGTWTSVAAAQLPRHRHKAIVAYDGVRDRVIVWEGTSDDFASSPRPGEIFEYQSAWTIYVPDAPSGNGALAADPPHHRFVLFGGYRVGAHAETWIWDGAWHPLATTTSPPPRSDAIAAFDPIRGAVVMYGGTFGAPRTDTWQLVGNDWTLLDSGSGMTDLALAMAYDPIGERLLLATSASLYSLPSTATTWTKLPMQTNFGTSVFYAWMNWSARDQVMALTVLGDAYNLVGDAWVRGVSPEVSNAVTDERTGTVNYQFSEDVAWQRSGGAWSSIDTAPATMGFGAAAYDPRTGTALLFGNAGNAVVTYTRTLMNDSPFESCVAGEDLDADLLAGCDDPDCWWSCAPACPPYTTCP